MKIQKDSRFLMIGDSITDCGRLRDGAPPSQFEALGRGYVVYTAALLGAVYPQLNIQVFNRGIGGNTVVDLEQRWNTDALALQPDWMSLMIGINDLHRRYSFPSEPQRHVPLDLFDKTYRKLLDAVRPTLRGLILLTPFYIQENRKDAVRADTDQYSQAVKKIAHAYDALLVDAQAIFDAAQKHQSLEQLGPDRVHPTPAGHMLLAKGLLDSLDFQW